MKYLFVFAHPDDDVLVAGSMFELARQGHVVEATWVTDTATMGGREARQNEARAVARCLGVTSVRFLNMPSQRLHTGVRAGLEILRAHLREVEPDEIVTVAYEGGHIDHDFVSLWVHHARGSARVWEYPLYSRYALALRVNRFAQGSCEWRPLSREAWRRKLQTMWIYRSQWPFMLPAAALTLLRRRREPYREVPADRDYSLPPHPGPLNVDHPLNRWMGCSSRQFQALALTLVEKP